MSTAFKEMVEAAAIADLCKKKEKQVPETSATAPKRSPQASTMQSSKKKFKKFDVDVYCDCGVVLNKHEMEAKQCIDCRVLCSAAARQ